MFDKETAQPVTPFDPNTSKPVESMQVNVNGKSKQVFATPVMFDQDQTEFSEQTQVNKMPYSDFYGMNKLDTSPSDPTWLNQIARGLVGSIASKPGEFAKAKIGRVEPVQFQSQQAFAIIDNLKSQGKIDDDKFNEYKAMEEYSKKFNEETLSTQRQLVIDNRKFVDDAGLSKEEQDGFLFDIGAGFGSAATAVAVSYITKNPAAAAAMFGEIARGSAYEEAIANGKSPAEARDVSALAGGAEGALEFVGLHLWMESVKASKPLAKIALRATTEAVQEASQEAAGELIMQGLGGRDKTISGTVRDIAYAGVIGFAVGAPLAGIQAVAEKKAIKAGIDPEIAKAIAEKSYNAENINEIVNKPLENQTSLLTLEGQDYEKAVGNFREMIKKFPEDMRKQFEQSLDATESDFEIIKGELRTQLEKTGRDPEEAEAITSLYENFTTRFAEKLGLNRGQVASLRRLQVQREGDGELTQEQKDFFKSDEFLQAQPEFTKGQEYSQEGIIKTETPAFKQWFGESKAINEQDKPLVMYHGTPSGLFEEFDKSKASKESDLGAGLYFTTSEQDASFNYEGGGPDFELKISRRAEQIEQEEDIAFEEAEIKARKELFKSSSKLDVFISIKNPAIVGGKNQTWLFVDKDTLSEKDFESEEEFEEAQNEAQEGKYLDVQQDFIQAIRNSEAEIDIDVIMSAVFENGFEEMTVEELHKKFSENEDLSLIDDNEGNLVGKEVFRSFLEEQGYDGIIDNTVQEKFPNMEIEPGTAHYVVFEPTQIKSVDNRGSFDPQNPNIFKQGDRGTFNRLTNVIKVMETADRSTVAHELGHYFLTMYEDFAPQELTTVMDWAGYKGKSIDDLSAKQEVDLQEKFARGFEAFLKEGKTTNPQLTSVFEKFREWLDAVYKDIKELRIKLSDDARAFFDDMLTPTGQVEATQQSIDAATEQLRQEGFSQSEIDQLIKTGAQQIVTGTNEVTPEEIQTAIDLEKEKVGPKELLARDGMKIRGSDNWVKRTFMPISTRLKRISPELMHQMRKFEFNVGLRKNKEMVKAEPFIKKYTKLSENDAIALDLALKNGDIDLRDSLLKKNNMVTEFEAVDKLFSEGRQRAAEVGIEFGEVENWFPRSVEDPEGLISFMKGTTQWTRLERSLKEADPEGLMTPEEQIDFLNNTMSKFDAREAQKEARAKADFRQRRTVAKVTPEMNRFYRDSVQAMLGYIGSLNQMVEAKRFWGLDTQNFDESIGSMAKDMIDNGQLDFMDEKELKAIIRARFNQKGTSGWVNTTKNIGYITVMGNPISAITQIGDLAFSMYKSGVFNTMKSLVSRKEITREDLGIEDIAQEFEDTTKTSAAVKKVFKAVGLDFMDTIGKNTTINAKLADMRQRANKGDKQLLDTLDVVFDEDAGQVLEDLKNRVNSDNVKYMLFSELSDVQPISRAEMPEFYLTGGNWRIFYMLKTYTVKQLDIYYNDIIREMPKNPTKAIGNLVRLSAALMAMGMTSDLLKDFILGRDIEPEDMVVDNMLKLMALSKYQIYNAKRNGIEEAVIKTFIPPIAPLVIADDIRKDAFKKKKPNAKDLRIWNRVPVGGKLYYWWFGGGIEAKKKQRKRKD